MMLSSSMFEAFQRELDAILEGEYANHTPCSPPPWEPRLLGAGFQRRDLDDVSYLLSVFLDETVGCDLLAWGTNMRSGWAWLLFHETAAGEHFFARMEASYSNGDTLFVLYWITVRAGFQGRFVGDAEGLATYLRDQKWSDLPKELPVMRGQLPLSSQSWEPKSSSWWIPGIALIASVIVYRVLSLYAQQASL